MKLKRTLLALAFVSINLFTFAQVKSDTILIEQTSITKWIADTTLTSKGKPTIKYYCIYKGQLVATNKTTLKNIALCEKYKAKCNLLLVTSKTGKRRIICK